MTVLIAHRGNINGPNPEKENDPLYLEEALKLGYFVETDIWLEDDEYYLGHDKPQYLISLEWLDQYRNKIFLHCKNVGALQALMWDFHCFSHDRDEAVLTSQKLIWLYPGVEKKLLKETLSECIIVMPEWNKDNDIEQFLPFCFGVCSDYVTDLVKSTTN